MIKLVPLTDKCLANSYLYHHYNSFHRQFFLSNSLVIISVALENKIRYITEYIGRELTVYTSNRCRFTSGQAKNSNIN